MLKQNYSLIPTNFLLNRIYSISLYIQNFRFLYMYLHDCFLQTFKVRIIENNDYNTKRALESVNLSRTLVFLSLTYIVYKDTDLKLFFNYFFRCCVIVISYSNSTSTPITQQIQLYFRLHYQVLYINPLFYVQVGERNVIDWNKIIRILLLIHILATFFELSQVRILFF